MEVLRYLILYVYSLQVFLLSLCVRGSWTHSVHCSSQQVRLRLRKQVFIGGFHINAVLNNRWLCEDHWALCLPDAKNISC